jgi:hypothetical protein
MQVGGLNLARPGCALNTAWRSRARCGRPPPLLNFVRRTQSACMVSASAWGSGEVRMRQAVRVRSRRGGYVQHQATVHVTTII